MSDYLEQYQQRSRESEGTSRIRIILIGIILATLPFYCVGGIAYFLAPNQPGLFEPPTNTPIPTNTTSPVTVVTSTGQPTQPFSTVTSLPTAFPSATLPLGVPVTSTPRATNTQPPTQTPLPTSTPLPQPTNTPFVQPTDAASATPIPFSD